MVGIKKLISERAVENTKPGHTKRPVAGLVAAAPRENETWLLCFKRDSQDLGQGSQTLHVIDGATHRTVGVDASVGIRAVRIIRFLGQMIDQNGRPHVIRCEHHVELRKQEFTDWCLGQSIELVFAPPGRPD